MPRSHPKFARPNTSIDKRVKNTWRKPRGIDSKQRMQLVWAGAHPGVGWRSPKVTRGQHPAGAHEVLVQNAQQLAAVPAGKFVRFAAKMGGRLRAQLKQVAQKRHLRILNG